MAKFTVNGIELELDLADADMAEKAEAAIKNVQEEAGKQQSSGGLADNIRAICGLVNRCFDTIFGDGAADKIFGEKNNMVTSIDAFVALTAEIKKQGEGIQSHTQGIVAQYSPNRLQRRHPDNKK